MSGSWETLVAQISAACDIMLTHGRHRGAQFHSRQFWTEREIDRMHSNENPQETNYRAMGMILGLIFGVPLGVLFGLILGSMAFISIGIGAGMVMGMAIGASMEQRHQEEQD